MPLVGDQTAAFARGGSWLADDYLNTHSGGRLLKFVAYHDAILCRALVRSLEIIGEASKKLTNEFKAAHPDIEWKKIGSTRDKLIHDYFGVDYDIVWDINY